MSYYYHVCLYRRHSLHCTGAVNIHDPDLKQKQNARLSFRESPKHPSKPAPYQLWYPDLPQWWEVFRFFCGLFWKNLPPVPVAIHHELPFFLLREPPNMIRNPGNDQYGLYRTTQMFSGNVRPTIDISFLSSLPSDRADFPNADPRHWSNQEVLRLHESGSRFRPGNNLPDEPKHPRCARR